MANKIGILLEEGGIVYWTIQDIFTYETENKSYCSPCFSVSDCKWHLTIYPYGMTKYNAVGWISVFLWRKDDCASPKAVDFSLGLKKADGTIEIKSDLLWIFNEEERIFGRTKFLEMSELLKRRSVLAPSDSLTITCTLRKDDKADCITLSGDFKDMFLSKKFCDATMKVKHVEFSVHRFILAARSPVFAAMFEVDMKEKNTSTVNIEDCDPESFKNFLLCLYSGKLENISNNLSELYRIADKYDVQELKKACVISMMVNLSVENVCDGAVLAHFYFEFGLQVKTKNFFNENFREIVSTAKWKSLLKENHTVANELLKSFAKKLKVEDK